MVPGRDLGLLKQKILAEHFAVLELRGSGEHLAGIHPCCRESCTSTGSLHVSRTKLVHSMRPAIRDQGTDHYGLLFLPVLLSKSQRCSKRFWSQGGSSGLSVHSFYVRGPVGFLALHHLSTIRDSSGAQSTTGTRGHHNPGVLVIKHPMVGCHRSYTCLGALSTAWKSTTIA